MNMTELAMAKTTGVASAASAFSGVYFALTDPVLVSLITSSGALILGCFTVYFAYKAKVIAKETKDVSDKTHGLVNSRMTEFMEMARKHFHAEGVAQEKSDEADRKTAGEKP